MTDAENLAECYRILGGLRGDLAILRARVISDCLHKELDTWGIKDRLEMETGNLLAEIYELEGEVAAQELLSKEDT